MHLITLDAPVSIVYVVIYRHGDFTGYEIMHLYGLSHSPFKEMYNDMYSHLYIVVIGSHKKPVEPVEPVVSDTMSSQSGSSFAMAPSYSDHMSTSSSISTTGDGLTQSGTQSVTQPKNIDDVMATISTSAQGSNQIEVPTMSLSSRLTVAINSSVSINSNSTSITTTMSSLEPYTSKAVSSQSQASSLFAIRGTGSSNILSGTGKMTPPPPASYAETADNKSD